PVRTPGPSSSPSATEPPGPPKWHSTNSSPGLHLYPLAPKEPPMRSTHLAVCIVGSVLACAAVYGADPAAEKADAPFWLAPKVNVGRAPAAVKFVSAPDSSRALALLQVGDSDPRNFVVGNPKSVPFLTNQDAGYGVIPGGLKVGVLPYGDRKYK